MKREDIEKILTDAGVDEQKLKLFTISGTSGSEAAAAMLQLTRAMGFEVL